MTPEEAFALVQAEVARARSIHRPMVTIHDGWAVIYEEFVKELGDEVFRNPPNPVAIQKEAVHTAAMAIRFLIDLCEAA